MVREFNFPDKGEGIAEGEIISWLVKEGDWVKEDQDLVEVETDKAVVALPSPYAGKVVKLHGDEGDVYYLLFPPSNDFLSPTPIRMA